MGRGLDLPKVIYANRSVRGEMECNVSVLNTLETCVVAQAFHLFFFCVFIPKTLVIREQTEWLSLSTPCNPLG